MVTNHWARFCEPGPWGFVEVEEKSSAVGEASGSAGIPVETPGSGDLGSS